MIEAAAILSALVQHWADFGIILDAARGQRAVGFWEEFQAGNAIAALQSQAGFERPGQARRQVVRVPARELVPGDIVRVRLGRYRAGRRPVAGRRSGRSRSVGTDRRVVARDAKSRMRRSIRARSSSRAKSTPWSTAPAATPTSAARPTWSRTAHTASHFQKAVLKIGDFLIVIAVVLVILILLVALFRGDPMLPRRCSSRWC